ncbi:MAG: hypothetical protein ACE5DS_06840 [Kiloniellaceae bacterium]
MTKLLKEVLGKISKLSPERQDAFAALLLAEMEDEARWDKSFAESQDALEKLADEALDEHKRGETRPFDEAVFGEKG